MKKILLGVSLIMLTVFARAQQGLENIIVEKYYISDANDAAGATGNGDALPAGSTTYRIYVDMLPGYKFQAAFGTQDVSSIPLHTLKIMTSTSFYNNTDRGHEIPSFSKTNAAQNTTMLDSYFSAGAACANGAGPTYHYGILKADDGAAGGANVVNANGLLQNSDPAAGTPLTTADGIYGVSSPLVSAVTFVNMAGAQSDFDAGPSSNSFITSNASWASLAGATGPTADNRVLIGQFTTDGCFHFELNIQIGTPTGGVQKYVTANPTGSEILFPACVYPLVASNTAAVSIAPTPVVPLCAGSTVTFTATPVLGGAAPTYQWKNNGANVGTNSASYTTTLAPTDHITCELTSNLPCVYGSPATSNTISVFALPSVSANNASGCTGNPITLTGSPSGGNFSVANPYTGSSTTYTYTYTDVNGCSATSAPATITVNTAVPSTPGTISGMASPVCAGTSQAYSVTNVSGVTYNWTAPANASISTGQGTNSVTVNFLAGFTTGYINVNATNGCGTSANRVLLLKSVPSTPGTITGQATEVCAGSSHAYSIVSVGGVTYNWIAPANASISSGQGTNSVTVDFLAGFTTGSLAVNASNACGNSANRTLLLKSIPSTPGTITGVASPVCAGSSHAYSIASVSGVTYNWIAPANASISSGQGTNSVTVDFLAGFTTGSLAVNASNSCGSSTNRTLSLKSVPSQPSGIVGQTTAICPGLSLVYSVTNVAGVTYNWSVSANASIASGQGTNSVTVDFLAGFNAGTITVNGSNACGNSIDRTLALKSIPSTPGTITGPSTEVCAGSSHVYSVTSVSGVTYNWIAPANASIASGQGTNSVTVDFLAGFTTGNLNVNATYGCGNSANRVLVLKSVASTPGTMTGTFIGLCGQTNVAYSVTSVAGVTYNWSVPSGASINGGQGTNAITVDYTGSVASGNVSVTADNACGASPIRTAVVKTTPATPAVPTGSTSVCANQVGVPYSIASVAGATSYVWTVPTGSTVATGQGSTNITVNFGSTGGKVTVYPSNACGNGSGKYTTVAITCREVADAEGNEATALNVYPNPSSGEVTVEYTSIADEHYNLQVFDMSGRTLLNKEASATEGVNLVKLDLSSYAKGIYMIKFSSATKNVEQRIVVQ